MVVLIALYGEAYDDRIQKRGIVNGDVAATKIVSNVKLEFISTGRHRSTVKQGLFCATIGIRCSKCNLLALLSQRK